MMMMMVVVVVMIFMTNMEIETQRKSWARSDEMRWDGGCS